MKDSKIKFLGVMVFITVLLDVVPSAGFITVGSISITTMQIPTIITSIALGPMYGLITGTLLGVLSLTHSLSRESAALDVLFRNPFVSVLPRMCIALVTGYLFVFLKRFSRRRFKLIPVAVSSLAGSLANTFFVLLAFYLIYPQKLASTFDLSSQMSLFQVLMQGVKFNCQVEAIVSTVVSTVTFYITYRLTRKSGIQVEKMNKSKSGS